MNDHRELLELAARAMGLTGYSFSTSPNCFTGGSFDAMRKAFCPDWKPHTDSGDCADMCAALGIDSIWWDTYVRCEFDEIDADAQEYFRDHNNDRSAAWRLAALRVAAEIGKGMRG